MDAVTPEVDETLVHVSVWICRSCLRGDDGECHSAGCLFWLRNSAERPLMEHRYEEVEDAH